MTDRFRSKHKGVCYCCANDNTPLYPVGTAVGVKLCCAK